MGIYIRGMEMPKTCSKCKLKDSLDCERWKRVRSIELDKHRDCPLVRVPPHGDLVERKAVEELAQFVQSIDDDKIIWLSDLDDAPTIISASEEGEI